jgi:hypothetical protein
MSKVNLNNGLDLDLKKSTSEITGSIGKVAEEVGKL